eukprot:TRINITY_DN4681_c0_g1_i2.p1 TRINITY_DN4681_c0_g1~~TRINITY_DN4681_c0_g1_i2.p1  ORF type:complete len:129 (+),score=23.68 TRINITY_DN4681_c0_g1_i2:430-816(+)
MSGECMDKKRKELMQKKELEVKMQSRKTVKSRGNSEVVMRLQGYGKMYEERREEQMKDVDYTFKPTLNHAKNVKIRSRYKHQTPSVRRASNEHLTFKPKICKLSATIANGLVRSFSILGKSCGQAVEA